MYQATVSDIICFCLGVVGYIPPAQPVSRTATGPLVHLRLPVSLSAVIRPMAPPLLLTDGTCRYNSSYNGSY